jgi:hypothetical protein
MVISKANAEGELKGIIPLSDGHIGFMVDYDKINALEGDIKPYLRSLSSMTEEELNDLSQYSGLVYDNLILESFQNDTYKCLDFYLNEVPADVVILVFDWLNKNHFDYRGLIPKGLALEAPEDMYNSKTICNNCEDKGYCSQSEYVKNNCYELK